MRKRYQKPIQRLLWHWGEWRRISLNSLGYPSRTPEARAKDEGLAQLVIPQFKYITVIIGYEVRNGRKVPIKERRIKILPTQPKQKKCVLSRVPRYYPDRQMIELDNKIKELKDCQNKAVEGIYCFQGTESEVADYCGCTTNNVYKLLNKAERVLSREFGWNY